MKRFQLSNGLDTELYKNYLYFFFFFYTKTLPQMSLHIFVFAIFPLWGSTHNFANCWSADRSPASNVCTTDAWLGGIGRVPPPNKNPGYAGGLKNRAPGRWLNYAPVFQANGFSVGLHMLLVSLFQSLVQ